MKALTISQPYASLIASGEKWVENRMWATAYTGPLLIHAGKGRQYLTAQELEHYPIGAAVAHCRLVACVELRWAQDQFAGGFIPKIEGSTKDVMDLLSHKHAEGPWCWILEDIVPITPPVRMRGAQGLWDTSYDPKVPQ